MRTFASLFMPRELDRHSPQPAPSEKTRSGRTNALKALLGFAAIAVIFFLPLLQNIGDHILSDDIFLQPGVSDSYTSLWNYWWTFKAVNLGQSPLFSDWVLPPFGADLTYHSTTILPELLTAPLFWAFGTVVAYNLMILLLLIFGSYSCFLTLSKVFEIRTLPAFVSSAIFGFSPYFVLKAHAHINLIGAAFWVGALGMLLAHYLGKSNKRWLGIGYAILLWATFWSSLLEVLILMLIAAILVVYFELEAMIEKRSRPLDTLWFFAPSLLGSVSLLIFLGDRVVESVARPVFEGFSPACFISFSNFCVIRSPFHFDFVEFQGNYLSIALIVATVIGLVQLFRTRHRFRWLLVMMLSFCLVVIIDPWHVPSTLIRMLPFGTGFRAFSRFQAGLLFFMAVASASGFQHLFQSPVTTKRRLLVIGLVAIALVEIYPYRLNPSSVRTFNLPVSIASQLDNQKRVLVIPNDFYLNVHDTYQIALDHPTVYLSYSAREDPANSMLRKQQFPIVYGSAGNFGINEYVVELQALGVGYVLFEDQKNLSLFPLRTELLWRDGRQVLLEISDT